MVRGWRHRFRHFATRRYRPPLVSLWFQNLYAQGLDTPIERSVHLVLRLDAERRRYALWPLHQCGG
jgi:hypothetical protein